VFTFICLFGIEFLYISNTQKLTQKSLDKKLAFVHITKLSDLAFSTEATYIRHRSLSSVFSLYKDDLSLREYMPTTFSVTYPSKEK